MKINSIEISNLGVISDVKLDMSSPNGKLVFVNGSNGRGKTTFQSALRWCFYGENPPETKFVSKYALAQASNNQLIDVSVKVEIIMDQEGQTAYIERKQVFEKVQDGVSKMIGHSELIVKIKNSQAGGFTNVEVNPELWLKRYFPERLINFFLFDGELMANFFEKNVRSAIEDAIREIAGVDLFEQISAKLQQVEANLDKEISKLTGPKAEKANQDLVNKRKILAAVYSDRKETEVELHAKKSRREDVIAKLGDSEGLASSSRRLSQLDGAIEAEGNKLREAESELQAEVLLRGTTGLLKKCFASLYDQVAKAEAEDRLPPPFEPARIQQLIDSGTCLCGTHLLPDSDLTEALKSVIERYKVASDIGRVLDKAHRQIQAVEVEQAMGWKLIDQKNKSLLEVRTKLESLKAEKDSLILKLQGHDAESIRLFADEKQLLDVQIEDLITKIASFNNEIERYVIDVEKLTKDFHKFSEGNEKAEILKKKSAFAGQVHAAASSIHQLAIKHVRRELEKSVSKMFSVVKKGSFKTEITENFEVNTLHLDGTPVELSEGEKMMKAYIFSIALREVIKLGFPLIVDTPFGRLDQYNQNQLAIMLSEFLKSQNEKENRQVIFSMQDSEYTPYTQKHFVAVDPIVTYLGFAPEDATEKIKATLGYGVDPDWYQETAWKDWKAGKIK